MPSELRSAPLGLSKPGASFPLHTLHARSRVPTELSQRLPTFQLLRGERAGRGPRRQLSCFGERAAIHGTQIEENTKKHTIYVINTSENGKSYWNRAGVAFGNRDGSFTLKLDILPQTKFQLREEKPVAKEEAAAE